MKHCPSCGQDLPLGSFGRNKAKPDGLASYCRPCKKQIDGARYQKRRPEHIEAVRRRTVAYRRVVAERILRYLQAHPCVDCGEPDPVVLEFDHVRGVKRRDVGEMAAHGWGWVALENEIAKCVVRCANCHRRRTSQSRGWFRGLNSAVVA